MKGKFRTILLDTIRVTNRASNNEEEEDEKTTTIATIMVQQRAFVFIKPHACVPKNDQNLLYKQDLVEVLNRNDVNVVSEGKYRHRSSRRIS